MGIIKRELESIDIRFDTTFVMYKNLLFLLLISYIWKYRAITALIIIHYPLLGYTSKIPRPPAFDKHIGLGIDSFWELLGQSKIWPLFDPFFKLLVEGNTFWE